MTALLSLLLKFLVPIISVAVALFGVIALILGAIQDPEGAVNTFLVRMIDNIAPLFPQTPESLKVANIIDSVGETMPVVGKAVVFEVFQTISIIFGILAVIKIYKLIPFKAT